MKINRFEMVAFGPFSDKVLDFSGMELGLHVIYGANEAGKSSALRALKAWLFGFPERTRDDFIHPRQQLLVGGELIRGRERCVFYRRKKRKGDMVDAAGNPVSSSQLAAFLGGLDQSRFEALYGIDHQGLVRGGRDILARRGHIGEALFAAGAGLGSLHRTLDAMEREKEALFRARGKNPAINQGIRRHRQLSRQIREATLAPSQWQELAEELAQINLALEEKKQRQQELDSRLRHQQRLYRALPLLARRQGVLQQLHDLGPVKPLPDDFSQIRSHLQQEIRSRRQALVQARDRLARIQAGLAALSPRLPILERQEEIETAMQHLGRYRKAQEDRPRLQGMRRVLRHQAEDLLTMTIPEYALEQMEDLMPLLSTRKKLLHLCSRFQALNKALQDGENRQRRAMVQLQALEEKIQGAAPPADWTPLAAAIAGARKQGDIDSRIAALVQEGTTREAELTLALEQVGFWRGDLGELATLALPPQEVLNDFAARLEKTGQELSLVTARLRERRQELLRVQRQLQELVGPEETLPSAAELAAVRRKRDQGWHLVCRSWLQGEDISQEAGRFAPGTPLELAFYHLVEQADQLGDRLRLEADRVQAFGALQAREQEITTLLREDERQEQALLATRSRDEHQWQALWQALAIEPASPGEMSRWRSTMVGLQQQALDLHNLERQRHMLEKERHQWWCRLRSLVRESGEEPLAEKRALEPLLVQAETLLARLQEEEQQRRQAERDLQRQNQHVRELEQEMADLQRQWHQWHDQWRELARLPGQEEVLDPETAPDLLDGLNQVVAFLREAAELESRIRGIDRDGREFAAQVETLVRQCAPELADLSPTEAMPRLQALLRSASQDQARHQQYSREKADLEEEIAAAELALDHAGVEMEKLLQTAGVRHEEDLVQAEEKAATHQALERQLQEIEQDLRQVGGTTSFASLEQEASQVDPDQLPGTIHELKRLIREELDPAIKELYEQKGKISQALEQMDGSSQAAQAQQELYQNLARLRRDADLYVRLQVGVELLRREAERYRRKNQGPVLAIASGLFTEMTLGSFSGLKTDVNDQGEPILVGVRDRIPKTIGVEAMSTGSRDQLFLALRLASLRHRAEKEQVLPHIFDDILINFDEPRAAATMEVLARMGRHCQLILFTHHRQVADLATNRKDIQLHLLE